MTAHAMHRRSFLRLLSGASAAAWPLAAGAQQAAMPVIGYLGGRSAAADANYVEGFRQGLAENGYVVGQSVAIEFRWVEEQPHRLAAMAADLVRRRVAVIVASSTDAALAAKAATTTIPIVFSGGSDPVQTGVVAS